MNFVQIIEYETDQPDEVRTLSERWSREHPLNGPIRVTVTEDRERRGHFVMIAEFNNYEHAMEHSKRTETTSYANRMRLLAKSERFVNLDVAFEESCPPRYAGCVVSR